MKLVFLRKYVKDIFDDNYFVIQVADWKVHDTLKWLNDIELSRLIRKALPLGLTGRHLLSISENELISRLEIEDDEEVACNVKILIFDLLYQFIISNYLSRRWRY